MYDVAMLYKNILQGTIENAIEEIESIEKMKQVFLKRSWVEINLEIIEKNYSIYKNYTNNDVMAVVKADAYGHGDVEIAMCLQNAGVNLFAVSNILEAIKLRDAGIRGEILILGYTPLSMVQKLLEYDIIQTIISVEYGEAVIKSGLPIRCQIAIDTGMNRIGIDADKVANCEAFIRRCNENLCLEGVFTHLCVADGADETDVKFTKLQIEKFEYVVERIEDLCLRYIHYANSVAGLRYKGISNLTRLGIILYGLKPSYEMSLPNGIIPALSWKSVVSMVKTVCPGESIGYGCTYHVEKEIKVATIPTGYADGYSRLLSNRGKVLIHGQEAPIIGRICMDQFMIDVSNIPNVKVEDEVVLLGESENELFTADDMANIIGTIGYEVVCNISKRVQRVYVTNSIGENDV